MDAFTERQLREKVAQLVFNWINLGYTRDTIIRMVIAEGFGENYATSVTNDAFEELTAMYNEQ